MVYLWVYLLSNEYKEVFHDFVSFVSHKKVFCLWTIHQLSFKKTIAEFMVCSVNSLIKSLSLSPSAMDFWVMDYNFLNNIRFMFIERKYAYLRDA